MRKGLDGEFADTNGRFKTTNKSSSLIMGSLCFVVLRGADRD